jgi:radical SAM superfamily enzyme YgiQ (UPF0313 family)
MAPSIQGRRVRAHSPERVVEELRILRDQHGARGVCFHDSTFTIDKARTMKLLQLMVRADLGLRWTCNTRTDRVDHEICDALRAAGCRQVALGIESGNQASLDIVGKGTTVERQTDAVRMIHAHGMETLCSYILCLPGETEEMAEETISYARSLASRVAMFYLPVPYPGSALFDACSRDGGLRMTHRWSDYLAFDFDDPVYVNPLIGRARMRALYRRAYALYYRDPRVWFANIRALRHGMPISAGLRGLRAAVAVARGTDAG